MDHRVREDKKVSMSYTPKIKEPSKIKRRQTGFVRPEDLEKVFLISQANSKVMEEEDEESTISVTGSRKVRIAESSKRDSSLTHAQKQIQRKQTGFFKSSDSDTQVRRQSALSRMYDNMPDIDSDEEGPTLRDYKSPSIKVADKNFMLTQSPISRIKHFSKDCNYSEEDFPKEHQIRQSIIIEGSSIEHVLDLQHSKKFARKVSSDYVKTIDQIEHKLENSIRSVEFARTRPSMSVFEYQKKNKHLTAIKKTKETSEQLSDTYGLRLPGDTPLYSMTDMESLKK